MAHASLWLTAASILTAFKIEMTLGADGKPIEPSSEFATGLNW